jgi:hypothetical protein
MANRLYTEFSYSLEKRQINLFAKISFGAAGAPTLQQWDPRARTYSTANTAGSKGIKSVTRVSAGLYTVNLLDPYNHFIQGSITFLNAAAAAAPLQFWPTTDTTCNQTGTPGSSTGPSVQIQFANTSGTATDPGSGEAVIINLTFTDSTAI